MKLDFLDGSWNIFLLHFITFGILEKMLLLWLMLLCSSPYRPFKPNVRRAEGETMNCVGILWNTAGAPSAPDKHGLFCASSIHTLSQVV